MAHRTRENNAAPSSACFTRIETAGERGEHGDVEKKEKEQKNRVVPLLERHGYGLITRRCIDGTRCTIGATEQLRASYGRVVLWWQIERKRHGLGLVRNKWLAEWCLNLVRWYFHQWLLFPLCSIMFGGLDRCDEVV